MAEWRRCPGCGFTKCGACPQCFPVLAEAERQAEIAQFRREQEQQHRRSAGLLRCPEHDEYDRCWQVRSVRERRGLTWQEAMTELRRRYVPEP